MRGDFAGILGLKWVPPDMPFAPAVELLYRLIPRFWGQGFATDGSLAALEFGFCELHLDTVVAFAVEANTGSRRVKEKVGMVYGSDFDHPSIPELSPLRRHVLYSLKRANWHEKSSPIRILVCPMAIWFKISGTLPRAAGGFRQVSLTGVCTQNPDCE